MINKKKHCAYHNRECFIYKSDGKDKYCKEGWYIVSGKLVKEVKKKEKSESVTILKKKLDDVFSKYIRLLHMKDGLVSCYTCGKSYDWKKIQNGHFHSRSHLSLRWEEKNCRPQCVGCNVLKHGNYIEYYQRLEKEIGSDGLKWLEIKKNNPSKLGTFEIRVLINDYTLKVDQLIKINSIDNQQLAK